MVQPQVKRRRQGFESSRKQHVEFEVADLALRLNRSGFAVAPLTYRATMRQVSSMRSQVDFSGFYARNRSLLNSI